MGNRGETAVRRVAQAAFDRTQTWASGLVVVTVLVVTILTFTSALVSLKYPYGNYSNKNYLLLISYISFVITYH